MEYRAARSDDAAGLAEVYYRAVREGARRAYTAAECAAWAPERPTAEAWRDRLSGLETIVAEDARGLCGFMSVRLEDGELDLAFVLPEAQGSSVADGLYSVLENRARSRGVQRLTTHASHLARPFFDKHGWRLVRPNHVTRHGVTLSNWIMEKPLH